MPFRLTPVEGNPFEAAVKSPNADEMAFRDWYKAVASSNGLNPNPDDPQHFYDYRAAWRSGVSGPDATGHWPSEYKLEGHPRMVVDGINTKTGAPVGFKMTPVEGNPFAGEDGYAETFGKGLVRGVEGMAGGVGSAVRWAGEALDAPTIAQAGKTASDYWEGAQKEGFAKADPATFSGTFMQNPSLKRASGIVAEALPSLFAALATGSAAMRVGLSAGKAAAAAAGGLGVLEGAPEYEAAREKGLSVGEASKVGAANTLGTAMLEALPIGHFLKGLKGGTLKRMVRGGTEEAGQEAAQTLWQNMVAKYGYDKTRGLADGLAESIIGGFGTGGPAGALYKQAADMGIPKEEVDAAGDDLINQMVDKEIELKNEPQKAVAPEAPVAVQEKPAQEQPPTAAPVVPQYIPVQGYDKPLSPMDEGMDKARDRLMTQLGEEKAVDGPPRATPRDIELAQAAGISGDEIYNRTPETDIKPEVLRRKRAIREAEQDISDLSREIDKIKNITDKTIAARRKLLEQERRTLEDKIEIDQVEIARMTGQEIPMRDRGPDEVRRGLRDTREAESVLLQAGHLDSGQSRQAPYRLTPVDGNPFAVEAEPAPSSPPAVAGEAKQKIKTDIELLGAHHGQKDLVIVARGKDSEYLGRLDYTEFEGTPSVSMIEVEPEHRRKGIGTELINALKREYPNIEIDYGDVATKEGSALIDSIEGKPKPTETATLPPHDNSAGVSVQDSVAQPAPVAHVEASAAPAEGTSGGKPLDRPTQYSVKKAVTGKAGKGDITTGTTPKPEGGKAKERLFMSYGAEVYNGKVVLFRGGNVARKVLSNLRYGDYLSASETGYDATGNEGAAGYGKNVVRFELPIEDVEVTGAGEFQYKGKSKSLSGGNKYPDAIYRAYNDYYGSNYSASEIDKQDNVRVVASMSLAGGRDEFDSLLNQHKSNDQSSPPAKGGAVSYRTQSPQQAAEANNVKYDGEQERPGKSPLLQFTDNETGATFYVEDVSEIPGKLPEIRKRKKPDLSRLTKEDIKAAMPWAASVRKRKTDNVWIVESKNGRVVRIKEVEQIAIDEAAFKIEYGRSPQAGEAAAGSYKSGEIKLSKVGDKWVLSHESFHWLRDLNVITSLDLRAIDKAIGKQNITDEDRANWYEAQQKKRGEAGRIGRILQKIGDFIDSWVNLFHRTARGVVRDIESGKALTGKGQAPQTTVPQYEKTAARWYSQMQKFLEAKLPGSGSPAQMKQTLQSWANKGEFKQDELEWSGVLGWLDGQDGKVTKQAVLDYLEANNLRVEEVVKSDSGVVSLTDDERTRFNELLKEADYLGFDYIGEAKRAIVENEDWASRWDVADISELVELGEKFRWSQDRNVKNKTKFSGYQLPGGENYRELLITMPSKTNAVSPDSANEALMEYTDELYLKYPNATSYEDLERLATEREVQKLRQLADSLSGGLDAAEKGDAFFSAHWDEPNVLAHVRFSEREVDGKKILHIEEVQSDWHQKGRKEGYKPQRESETVNIDKRLDAIQNRFDEMPADPKERESLAKEQRDLIRRRAEIESREAREYTSAAPDAPWKKTWPIQAFKRMVRYAAENGFDGVAWTQGDEQVRRYKEALQQAVDKIEWTKQAGGVRLVGYKNGKQVVDTTERENAISDAIGKSMGDSILGSPDQSGVFEGDDITISDTGMAGFYDKILPAEVNKFFGKKAWGSPKVGTIGIPNGADVTDSLSRGERAELDRLQVRDPDGFNVWERGRIEKLLEKEEATRKRVEKTAELWHLPITPEMSRKALTEGMPLYKAEQYKTVSKDLKKATVDAYEKLGAFFGKTGLTKPGKQDLSYWKDLVASVPMFFKQKIGAVNRIVDATQDRQDDFHNNIFYMENHGDKAEINVVRVLKDLRKVHKSYKKVKRYILAVDRTGKGFSVKKNEDNQTWDVLDNRKKVVGSFEYQDPKNTRPAERQAVDAMILAEAKFLANNGFSAKEVQAVVAFRKTMDKGFEMLFAPMRELIERAAKISKEGMEFELPMIATMEDGKPVKISLEEAMARMGDLRGTYFPRIRPRGRFVLTAHKDGQDSELLTFAFERVMNVKAHELRKKGYRVETSTSKALPEDVFEMAGELVKTQQVINAAMDKVDKALKTGSGQTEIDSMTRDIEKIFATAVAEQVTNVIRERGSRAHMTRRAGTYYKGFEEGLDIATAKYIRSLSGGDAKRVMVLKMMKALTGTTLSWKEFKEQNRNADYDAYVIHVRKEMIDAREQPHAFKWAKAYINENTRNREFADEVIGVARGIAVGKYLAFRVFSAPLVNLTALATSVPASMKAAGIPLHKVPKFLVKGIKGYAAYRWNKGEISKEDKWVYDEIRQKGWDSPQFNSEAMTVLKGKLGRSWDAAIEYGMLTFGESERINRIATIAGAYHGLKKHNPMGLSDGEILAKAKQVSDDSHGVYNKGNYPYLALGGNPAAQVIRSAYVFKTFSHTYMLNMAKLGFKNKAALAYALIAPAIIAGAGASVLTPLISMVLKAVGLDDPEEEAYRKVGKMFGPTSESLARFGLTGLGGKGISIKGSLAIGIGDMPTTFGEFLGAPWSVMKDFGDSARSISRGDVAKGIEKALPTGFGNVIRSFREYDEGVTTRTNAPVFYGNEQLKPSLVEAFWRGFSFNPAGMAEKREKQWKDREREERFSKRRYDIYAKIKRFKLGDEDPEDWAEILGEVEAYNEKVRATGDEAITLITPQRIKTNLKRSFSPSRREKLRQKP